MKFLIIRFSSIGDILLCTPVFRLVKKKFPSAEIHFLTKKSFGTLLSGNQNIDRIFTWENSEDRLEMFHNEYNAVIDLHSNLRSLRVKLALWNVPHLSLKKNNILKLLFTVTKNSIFRVSHIVDRYIETLKPFNLENDNLGLDYDLGSEITMSMPLPENYVCFVLGGTYYTKRIPKDKILESIQLLQDKKVLLIGGKDESRLGDEIHSEFPKNVINFCGKISIEESAFVLKNAKIVVSGDTGMAHLASALGKPLAMIWGNTDKGYGMGPCTKQGVEIQHFVVSNLGCHPCSKLGYNACPKGHFACMKQQKMSDVSNFIEKYL